MPPAVELEASALFWEQPARCPGVLGPLSLHLGGGSGGLHSDLPGTGESDLPAWSLVPPRGSPAPKAERASGSPGQSLWGVGGSGLALAEKKVEVRGRRSCPGASAPSPDVWPEPSAWGAGPTDHTPAKRSELVSAGARRPGLGGSLWRGLLTPGHAVAGTGAWGSLLSLV